MGKVIKNGIMAIICLIFLSGCSFGPWIDQDVKFTGYSDCCGELYRVSTYVGGWKGFSFYFQESFHARDVKSSEIEEIKKTQRQEVQKYLDLAKKCSAR